VVFFSNLKQSFVKNIFENLPAFKLYLGTPVKKNQTIFRSYPFKERREREREKERTSQGDYRI